MATVVLETDIFLYTLSAEYIIDFDKILTFGHAFFKVQFSL